MPWYLFALATPILYSFTNFIDKFLLEKRIKDPLAITAIAGMAAGLLGVIIGIITGFARISLFQTALIVFAGILLIFYLLPYFEAMKMEDASRVVPLFQFIPIFTLILSSIFLQETLTTKQMIGLLIVVAGGVFISSKGINGSIFKPRRSLWLMLLASLMYGSVGILFRFVVRDVSYWTAVSYEYIGTGIGGILLFIIPRVRTNIVKQAKQIRSSMGIITISNGLAVLAQMSEAYAVSLAAVPLVNIIGGVQPLIVLFEGLILTTYFPHLIKEDIRKLVIIHKLASIMLIFLGLYLVYF